MRNLIVTGGVGYIGSHACVVLMQAGYQLTILDNLSNSSKSVLNRISEITGVLPRFIEGDVRDEELLVRTLKENSISAALHFAGLKAVGESVQEPLKYYDNNVSGSLTLMKAMERTGVKTLVFSSSATVYGDPVAVPISEGFATGATNPYGRSKLMVEDILADYCKANPAWRVARLRYFNPVGGHESGLLGEEPNGIPNNLMPYVAQVAAGRRERLSVFGSDYPTKDGTGVRDYIHVMDLAEGHLAALRYLESTPGMITVNLGTGKGYSVLEMVKAFENASGQAIPYEVVDRRPGDIAECWSDPGLASKLLGWQARRGIDEMCRDTWRWQQWVKKNSALQ
ncbi:MAG TPA: UDP-glucose 4-epimerase GalE [Rhodocyclaceae bacterium]|jgi:UDP-glucose 4-epimerase